MLEKISVLFSYLNNTPVKVMLVVAVVAVIFLIRIKILKGIYLLWFVWILIVPDMIDDIKEEFSRSRREWQKKHSR